MVDLSPSTVRNIINRFVHENRVQNKGRNAPNKIFNERDKHWILRKVKKNPTLSAPKLADEAEKWLGKKCNPETIRRILRDANFHGRTARNKPYINKKNRERRMKFALEYINKDESFWESVIFADESKFNLFGPDGKSFVWREPNTEFQSKNVRPTIKHGDGHIMVWGCVASSGVGNLTFIEGNMNKEMYKQILENNLIESATKLGIKENFRFYQDNDPKHKSGIVQTWLIWNCPHIIKPPAQSPDLNVIENLWAVLERETRKHHISTAADLKSALKEEWQKITPEYTHKLVSSMPKRLNDVLKQKGYPTRY